MEGVFQAVCLAPFVVGAEPTEIQISVMLPVIMALLGRLTADDRGEVSLNFIAVSLPEGLGKVIGPGEIIPHGMAGSQSVGIAATGVGIAEETLNGITKKILLI